ncbi:hypothetical protein CPB84DRAFT_1707453 [Gymnopilus junonius]|uniref:Chromatin modification-related protein n=1 Tax=Gymnopilus junonius TaxID=109634 RepID=A0A9P5NRT2_GYMJU|nr:hypothetical protein CPB84DRAFT_1707453 [Gymnopilus junonius]
MSSQIPNLEEAANVATEFIYSIDNLPHEVSHILQEIRYCEAKVLELQQEIDKDSAKYIRHSRRASSASATPPSPSSRATSPKSVSIPAKVSACYAEIQELASEKCALAERLIDIITRTRTRLDYDIMKVRTLQGDSPEAIAASMAATSKPLTLLPTLSADAFGAPGRNPALAISESLRNALAIPLAELPRSIAAQSVVAASPPPASHTTKKRRLTTTTSIKISPAATPTKHRSVSPATTIASTHVQQKSRLSRQIQLPPEDSDQDAEGDEDMEAEEEAEDETPYCFCQKQSYGDMIACDNEGGCPYEWFHLACVGLKQPTPEKWYCSVCIKTVKDVDLITMTAPQKKGRKK